MSKEKIKYLEREINGYNRLIIDLNKSKITVEDLVEELVSEEEEMMILFNSRLASSDHIGDQVKAMEKFLRLNQYSYEIIKVQSDRQKNIMQKLFKYGGKEIIYKLAFLIKKEDLSELLSVYSQYNSNMHIGLKISSDAKEIQKKFVSNFIDDKNRFEFYSIDIFANLDLDRISIFSEAMETTHKIVDKIRR